MPDKNFRLDSKNVLVLCGGISNEHDISLLSAEYLVEALKKRHNVTVVRISKDGEWKTSDGRRCFIIPDRKDGGFFADQVKGPVRTPIDVVFPIIHGQNGEDGAIQGLLELAGIPYVGCDISASAICYDKALTKAFVQRTGVRQTKYICCVSSDLRKNMEELIDRAETVIGYPCFVKPARSGSSVGISHPKNRDELTEALYAAAKHDRKIIIEKAVYGRELECAVLGNDDPEASPVGEILPDDGYYDYDSKYHSSKDNTAIPEDLDEEKVREIRQAAIAVYKVCGCSGLSRVDFFLEAETNRVIFNEINTFPGFTPISMYPKLWKAEGLHIDTLCDLLIHFALERLHGRCVCGGGGGGTKKF
jgi:D-alanine-D-alanine ligase